MMANVERQTTSLAFCHLTLSELKTSFSGRMKLGKPPSHSEMMLSILEIAFQTTYFILASFCYIIF